MHKNLFLLALSTLLLIPTSASALFKDVGTTHQYQEAINHLQGTGCISGYQDGTFQPDKAINRAETLKLILTCLEIPKIYSEETFKIPAGASYILNGEETRLDKDSELKIKVPFNPDTYPNLEFTDINNSEWFIPVLKEALVRNIITGYEDKTIKAEKTVAKGEFFTMLFRVVPKELQKADLANDIAKDALVGQWFTEALAFAMQNKIIDVDADGNLNPFRDLNRGQVAHFIYLYKNWLTPRLAVNTAPVPLQKAENNQESSKNTEKIANNQDTEQQAEEKNNIAKADNDQEGLIGTIQSGKASYVGQQVASYKGFVAAHPTFPFGSVVTVTDPKTTKFVQVLIIDRGPNQEIHPDRIIDLSYTAFNNLLAGDKKPEEVGILNVEVKLDKLPS